MTDTHVQKRDKEFGDSFVVRLDAIPLGYGCTR